METIDIIVIIAGVASIAFVLWYFFGERESVAAQTTTTGRQEINVTVRGGYSPDVILLKKDVPVRMNIYRDETDSCSEEIVFGDFGISRHLPPFKTTAIEFTPDRAGEFSFTCGMRMIHGKLIVE